MRAPAIRRRRVHPVAWAGLLACTSLAVSTGCAPEAAPVPVAPPPPLPIAPPPAAEEPLPGVRLPTDTHPTSEALVLTVDPKQDRFSGVADLALTLDHPRSTLWMHGKGLHVTRATVTAEGGRELAGAWKERDESGMASLTLPEAVALGHVKVHIEYDAPWGPKLEGLHKIVEAGIPYAFTQFESIAARDAFPCFDEPGFKIPWDETLIVPEGDQAIANTKEVSRSPEGTRVRVHFAPTLPLPSYLVAFAVGPFDVVTGPDAPPNGVRTRPLPIRAITTRGRGKEIAYALAHTGEILATLEKYVGLEYPYDKLDILAEPGKGGAMENPGAVVFGDALLLFDPKTAPLQTRRSYAGVMAHELAHQWVGDLVTAAWWDDIWLNEAFATWIGTKATDLWDPTMDAAMGLLGGVQGAMGSDALVSARAIRQPILSTNDIENAFDGITYQKGGGVLSMFERWLGPEAFQKGLHDYLVAHRFGSGTADDFLNAESAATGKDVKTPFHTFLDQPGVPFLQAEVKCDGSGPRLHLRQSRYLPMGSSGDAKKTWQAPVCARYHAGKETKEACMLLTDVEGDLPLGGVCPDWVFPNANAAGYYRFSLAPGDLAKLRTKGLPSLSPRERVAFGNSLRAGFSLGTVSMKDALLAAAPLAKDPHRSVASEPMGFIGSAWDWLYSDPLRANVEAYGRGLYHDVYQRLGWTAAKTDDPDRVQLRSQVISFLAFTARDPAVRAEAKKRGLAFVGYGKDGAIHPEAVDPNLVGVALDVMGEDADVALWEQMKAQLARTEDAQLRGWLLGALSAARKPELIARARELVFDPILRPLEVARPIWAELGEPPTREATWEWVKANFDRLLAAVPKHHGLTQLIAMGRASCDEAHAKDVLAFFTPARLAQIEGGPRVLASTLEEVHLCALKRAAQEPSARAFFASKR